VKTEKVLIRFSNPAKPLKVLTMNRCKCVQEYQTAEGNMVFQPEKFYNFDYIPGGGQNAPFYRVFCSDSNAEKIAFSVFHKFFKKY
jgi:hypothetical protein